ncbi:MAG: phage tail protein, partial [Pseudomonadota bacterium]
IPMDFALDSCGTLYILDAEECNVLSYDAHTEFSEWLECFGGGGNAPGKFCNPQAIAVSPSNLYIADTCNHRIQTFARINSQLRWIVGPAEDSHGKPLEYPKENPLVAMEPLDLALDAPENLYVLDTANSLIQKFDQGGRFLGVIGEGLLENPTQLVIKDIYLYVLEAEKKAVLKFNLQTGNKEDTIILSVSEEFKPSGLAVDASGNFYLGRLDVIEEERFLYKFDASGKLIEVITEFQGACKQIYMDKKGNIYALNGETGEITFLEYVERFSPEGIYISKALDSGMLELQWHKLSVDAEIPKKTQITVSHYIADGKTLPSEPAWSQPMVNPKDALILSSQGQYLWLKFTLFGDEQRTPKIKSVRAYFPRISYLRYLPGIYQEDEASGDFLARFLSLFETFFFNLEEDIFSITKYFDVNATPFEEGTPERDFLTWLAAWLGVDFDENWTETQKREFLAVVPELYKKRGTREGLEEFIKSYTEEEPIIFEQFQLNCIKNDEANQKIWTTLFGGSLYSFCVLLNPLEIKYENDDVRGNVSQISGNLVQATKELNTVRRIVETEKPAHTSSGVNILQPWIYLDMHSYLGINSILSQPIFRLGQTSVISRDTVLADTEAGGQVERHARVEVDTILT